MAAANAAKWSGERGVTYSKVLKEAMELGLFRLRDSEGMYTHKLETLMHMLGARIGFMQPLSLDEVKDCARKGYGVVYVYYLNNGRGHAVFIHPVGDKLSVKNPREAKKGDRLRHLKEMEGREMKAREMKACRAWVVASG